MRKTISLVLGLVLLAAAGAFADFSVGLNGSLYMSEEALDGSSPSSIADRFQRGEGIYYGLMAELLGRNIGLAGSYMASFYDSAWGEELMNMDMNLALEGHLFGSRRILDPLIGVGLGYIFTDWADSELDDDEDNPIAALYYWYLDAGLGVNLGPVGIFAKFLYHFRIGPPEGQGALEGITLTEYNEGQGGLEPYKIVIGAKVMFPLIPRQR